MSKAKKQTAFRLSNEILSRLSKEAKKQNRSMANLVETLLDKYLPRD